MKIKNFIIASAVCLSFLPTFSASADIIENVTENTTLNDEVAETIYLIINSEMGTHLKATPEEEGTALSTIPKNATVELIDINSDWVLVSYKDQIGYIKNANVSFSDGAVSEAELLTQQIVDFAKSYLGNPYVYGGTNLSVGTDCSGFTYAVFRNFGINLGRSSRDQYLNGVSVSKDQLIAGDLVFFNGGTSTINHVGLYIGDGKYIHASTSTTGVIISDLSSAYSKNTYHGARRIIQ